ncbi:MAG: peptidylprolyl isomerase [Flavobacteriaceae bacterium]|jgi:peptidyl-prolyl cis-trans isomerase SurA|nr:peptidylprolyl isomerase [Flavobacteriaceae bacterium]MDG2289825.1 peptidylprolyl isomerase [Flavobacteriaceae bacterium]
MNKIVTLCCLLLGVLGFSQDSITPKKRLKIDGVSAVVGDYVILESDVDKAYIELESQGVSTAEVSRCNLLGKLMEDKLYAHHAEQDSIEVSNDDINNYVEQTIDYFVGQFGDIEKVLEFYKKKDEQSFRADLFEVNRIQQLSQRMQSKIVEDVEVTPDEVKVFFNSIPKEDLPIFGSELEVAQIVIKPKVSQEEEKRIVEQLETMRNDVLENGSSFSSKAILYSQDPGSRSRGGRYTLDRKRPQMVKEFREQAYRLQEGEISQPFKTDFGWHIVMVDKIRGRMLDVRHVLLVPTVSNVALGEAQNQLKLIKKRIDDGEISFADAAREFSDDQITRANGGVLINPATGDTRFELTKLDPQLYSQILKLEDNEISIPLLEEDRSGNKTYKIVMVTNRFNEHIADYAQDYVRIKDLALKEKQLKVIEEWMTEKISDTYISVNRDNQSCDFANNWLKK